MIEHFHFLRPAWLLALLPLAALIWYLFKAKHKSRSWQSVVDPELLPHLLHSGNSGNSVRQHAYHYLIAAIGLLSIIALAGPVWNQLPQLTFKQQSALVIVLDLSQSMNATDLNPSRLDRARYKITDIINQRKQGQTALVVYAGSAFTVVPLTSSAVTINALLPELTTDIIPPQAQGSRADKALKQAYTLFENTDFLRGDILLVSDGLNATEQKQIPPLLKQNPQYRLSILAIGSEIGVPIPTSTGVLKDSQGAIVISRLETEPMRNIVAENGGFFSQISRNDDDITQLLQAIEPNPFQQNAVETEYSADIWYEQGPWLVLLLLPLVALAFRRGVIFILPWLVTTVLLTTAPEAHAFGWNDLWQNKDQQGEQLFNQQKHQQAAETFDNPEWKAAASYRLGDYQTALEQWQGIDTESAHYNRGNALAKLGQLEEAIESYDQVLQKNPQHAAAKYNRQQVQAALEQQQKQQGDGEGDENQEGDESDQQKSEGQSSEADESEQNQAFKESDEESNESEQKDQAQQQDEDTDPESSEDEQSAQKMQESYQAVEQWLLKIPDNPGGLLREKIKHQYREKIKHQYETRDELTKEGEQW